MTSARALAGRTVDLLTLPEVYLRARTLLDDPDVALADVAAVIAHDPAMTARLLRIANSAFFGFGSRVATISRAVTILGCDHIHDLLLATSVSGAFRGIPDDVVDMRRYWEASVRRGVLARLVATRCNVLDTERLFVAGLLADVGHLVLYLHAPALAKEALVQARHEGAPIHLVERELIGFDYAELGAELLLAWRLPESLIEAVRWHPRPGGATRFPLEAAIVHHAEVLGASADGATAVIDAAAARLVQLDEDDLPALLDEAASHAADAIALLIPGAGAEGPVRAARA